MFAEWCAEAQQITEQTGDDEAVDVLNFLLMHTILAEPKPDGSFVTFESAVTPIWVACLALLPEDAQLCEAWRRELEEGFGVSFRPDCRTMVFNGNVGFSPTWKGILFLHEGHHAMTYARTPYNWQSARVFTERERDTHAFQNRLVWTVGGPPYQEVVERETLRLLASERWVWNRYPNELDVLFGPPASEKEEHIRQAHWVAHTGFHALERLGEPPDRQTDFLYDLYQQVGVLDGKEP